MARHKKKKHIRWSGVAFLALCFAGILYLIYLFVAWIVGFFLPPVGDGFENMPLTEQRQATPEQIAYDQRMGERIDSLVQHTCHLVAGSRWAIDVFDATNNCDVYGCNQLDFLIPASCMKIPLTIAAYELLGGDYKYRTWVDIQGNLLRDTLFGEVRLHAADDPLLLSLDSLAIQMRGRGIRAVKGRVSVDAYREDTLSSHPSTRVWDITWRKTPLMLRGKPYIQREWLASMRKEGISIIEDERAVRGGSWTTVAQHETPLTDILTPMLIHSSNIKAESVFYHLDRERGFIKDHRMHWRQNHAVAHFWKNIFDDSSQEPGIDQTPIDSMRLRDGSGLSPENRISAHLMLEMLRYAWNKGELRRYLIEEGLAKAGDPDRHGSFTTRLSREQYRNRIFIKTGTMVTKGVTSLAGYINGSDNHWYIFVIINNDSPVAEGRLFQDEFCRLLVK